MAGLTIITVQGPIEIPQAIEAQGGEAIDQYIASQQAPASEEAPPSEG